MGDFDQQVTVARVIWVGMDGPVGGADGAAYAGWQALVGIDVSETDVEA